MHNTERGEIAFLRSSEHETGNRNQKHMGIAQCHLASCQELARPRGHACTYRWQGSCLNPARA